MIEAALAQAAVSFFATKVTEGAIQAFGGDAYKTAIERLKGFLNYKFAGRSELNEIQNNPDQLMSLIEAKASEDRAFKSELENLVETLQEFSSNVDSSGTSYTNVDSVTNLDVGSVTGSNVSGHDVIAGNRVNGGQNTFGGDHRRGMFR
ncbi:MAG: hypothetical protein AAF827_00060 [Cyanobacteria bacterium P01_D01_bin.6]